MAIDNYSCRKRHKYKINEMKGNVQVVVLCIQLYKFWNTMEKSFHFLMSYLYSGSCNLRHCLDGNRVTVNGIIYMRDARRYR